MAHQYPLKVIITGGREVGGLRSFAEGLRMGFNELGIPVEIIAPASIFLRWRELRDPRVLKILSTTAVFAAPFARRAICMAHSVSRTYLQSFWKILAVIVTFKLANLSRGAQLIAVSDYIAAHLQSIFNVRIDAVIHNPLRSLFLESAGADPAKRNYITYVGRFDPAKNLHRLLPAIRDILNENPGLRICLAGDGPQRPVLECMAAGDERIEFPERSSRLRCGPNCGARGCSSPERPPKLWASLISRRSARAARWPCRHRAAGWRSLRK